jgi:hypothetical protein
MADSQYSLRVDDAVVALFNLEAEIDTRLKELDRQRADLLEAKRRLRLKLAPFAHGDDYG